MTLLGPALLASALEGCGRTCDPNVEDCSRRGGATYIHSGGGYYGGGGGGISGGTARGGFGGYSGGGFGG